MPEEPREAPETATDTERRIAPSASETPSGASIEPFPWRDYLKIRYTATWAGIGFLWLLTRLPLNAVLGAGRVLGPIVLGIIPGRAGVTEKNLELALPHLDAAARGQLAREVYRHVGMAFVETAWLWFRDSAALVERCSTEGMEHLDAAYAKGDGVILLQAHFTTIDVCAAVICARLPATAVYDPPKNPFYAHLQRWQRERFLASMIPNRDIRDMVRRLRRGEIVWFSPDQSVAEHHGGVPTRYFDQPVTTSSGTARIAAMTGATIVPMLPIRDASGSRYTLRFGEPLVLATDDTRDATQAVNDLLEAQVREHPEQYLWVHKRFKPPAKSIPSPYR